MPEEEEEEKVGIEEDEEEVTEEAKSGFLASLKVKLSKILGFIIGAILVLLLSVGAAFWVSSRSTSQIERIGDKIRIPPAPPYLTFPLGEFIVNIQGDDEDPHFIRANIDLAYGGEREVRRLQEELGKRKSQILDIVNLILKRERKEELDTHEGIMNMKIGIKEQINQILQSGKIKDIYFKGLTVM